MSTDARPTGSGTSALRLVASGTAVVAVPFGLARCGYGLLLPDVARDLRLDRTALGVVGSGAYVSYLLATAVCGRTLARLGQRATVAIGGVLATVGMLIIAGSSGAVLLGLGVFVAGAAPALVWPPYLDAVEQQLPEHRRDRGHSVVNSGTAYGVAIAAPLTLLVGEQWRLAWLLFAGCAAGVTVWAARTLPALRPAPVRAPGPVRLRPEAVPLLAASALIGLVGGAYWTFGVDAVTRSGLLGAGGGRTFQIVVGLAGLAGGLAGRLLDVLRPPLLFAALAACVSVAQLALASARGPVAAGAIADRAGLAAVFSASAVVAAALLLLAPAVPARRPR